MLAPGKRTSTPASRLPAHYSNLKTTSQLQDDKFSRWETGCRSLRQQLTIASSLCIMSHIRHVKRLSDSKQGSGGGPP